jgi:hypothetical protein
MSDRALASPSELPHDAEQPTAVRPEREEQGRENDRREQLLRACPSDRFDAVLWSQDLERITMDGARCDRE